MIAQLLYILPAVVIFRSFVTSEEMEDTSDVAIAVICSLLWPILAAVTLTLSDSDIEKILNSE